MRLAVSGYYGCGNTGDEAVLAGIADSFSRRLPPGAVEMIVLSADPADTRRQHGLEAVERTSLRALRRVLAGSDLLLSGGGSLLQDATSLRSLLYYLWVARLARLCGTPVMIYAQGVGPLRRRSARVLTRIVANAARCITVRDADSAELLRRIGVAVPPIEVTADPAFALRTEAPPDHARGSAQSGRPVIGVALRPWRAHGPSVPEYARMCRRISARTGAELLYLPMHWPGDVELAEQVAAEAGVGGTVVRTPLGPRAMLRVVERLSGMVGMRLHALIFAVMTGVAPVALSYDPKVDSFMARIGQPGRALPLEPFDPDAPAERLAQALAEEPEIGRNLRACAQEMAELALVNADRAVGAAQPK